MNKFYYLFLLLLPCFGMQVSSQESILLFDYDEVYPMTSSWADLMEPIANPAPDEVNDSRVAGLFIHNAQWSEIEIITDGLDLNARYYNKIGLKAFIPSNMPDGKVHITCKGHGNTRESRRRYDTFEITPPVKGSWFNIEHSFYGAYPIGMVQIGYRRSQVPDPVEDIAYFDELSFQRTKETSICLYRESFCIVYPENENANYIGNPSGRSGNWVGNVDLTSTGNIQLVKYPNTNSHVMRLTPTSADIVIPGITNLEEYVNLRLVFDARWVVDESKRDVFNTAQTDQKSPGIKVKLGNGAWNSLVTNALTDNWQTGLFHISPENVESISLSFGKGNCAFDFEIDNIMIFGTPKNVSGVDSTPEQKVNLYPNPVADKLYADRETDKMEVFSLDGSMVASETANTVSMRHLPKGVYLVKLHANGEIFVCKVVKD